MRFELLLGLSLRSHLSLCAPISLSLRSQLSPLSRRTLPSFAARRRAPSTRPFPELQAPLPEGVNRHVGRIASGSIFLSAKQRAVMRRRVWHEIGYPDCVEMENAGVAQICRAFGVRYLSLRALSDLSTGDASSDFNQFCQQVRQSAAPASTALTLCTSPHRRPAGANSSESRTHTRTHTHMSTHARAHTHHTRTRTHTHAHAHAHTRTRAHTRARTHAHTRTHTHTRTHPPVLAGGRHSIPGGEACGGPPLSGGHSRSPRGRIVCRFGQAELRCSRPRPSE